MLLDLGPFPAQDALDWSRFARRIIDQLRHSPDTDRASTNDLLEHWSELIGQWSDQAARCREANLPFRWSSDIEPEVAEFLLDGLDRCLHSAEIRQFCTEAEIERQRGFTVGVLRCFIDGLVAESDGCRHYADQVTTSLQRLLPD